MFEALAVRFRQGRQFIADLRGARPAGFRGRPTISEVPCEPGCARCQEVCPTQAIALDPVRIDLGRCVFCTECAGVCPVGRLSFTPDPRMAAARSEDLVVAEGSEPAPIAATLRAVFGRSVRLRQVSAGGCNACEMELQATTNVNFDLQRYGLEWVASPRHADGLVLTGPLTRSMAAAVQLSWDAMPEPKFLILVGACAISGGLYRESPVLDRTWLDGVGPVARVPGCPVHPLTFAHAILDLIGR